ncbi:MAX-2 protein [Aphelenchoides avenae]|nr:MAX-2 protein [Aphelenchus avenae]
MKWTFGSPFGIFNDQKVLATGGQGTVHLVELKRAFAVKKAQLRLDDPRTLEFLIQEGKYAYNLFHKNLLSVLYRYIDGYNAYLVYPLMDAGDVSAIMGRLDRCLTEAEAAFVIREVLDALVYLHSHNVAHRDIKPQNVLTNLKGEIMVADLGLCGDTTKPRVTGVGTPEFLPPELATARQRGPRGFKHDTKVDAWSLGVTLFELSTEHFPIQEQNLNTQYAQIRKSDFMEKCRQVVKTANMELSEECWAFLARCFVHYPQARATAQELRQSDFVKKAKPEDWTKAVRQVTEGKRHFSAALRQ